MATDKNPRATQTALKQRLVLALACFGLLILGASLIHGAGGTGSVGVFEGQSDVGFTHRSGSASYDAARHEYLVTGSGDDMWFTQDGFHYVWRRVSGDVTISADVRLQGMEGNEFRKAGLMIRQGLGSREAYADVVIHGNGHTALQYRPYSGADTSELSFPGIWAESFRLERHGNMFSLSAAGADHKLAPLGSVMVELHNPVYVGLAVCSHDNGVLQTASFKQVEISSGSSAPAK
jgi:TolB protein